MNTPFRISYLFFFLLLTSISYSQSLGINYNNTGAGQNYTGTFAMDIGKNTIGIGLGYTLNTIAHLDPQSNIFYKRQYASENLHHLNLNLFYHRSILPTLEHLNLFVFYDFQAKHSPAMNVRISNQEDLRFHGPYYWLENSVGLGFDVNIVGNLYLSQKFGGGMYFVVPSGLEADRINSGSGNSFDWEFMYLINVGLVYKLS